MEAKIALITILTDDVPKMVRFYHDVLGFEIKSDLDQYCELVSEGVRFAICARMVMEEATGHSSYKATHEGQCFELAFPLKSPEDVDQAYREITKSGAKPIKAPKNMPWGQRTAFFADPDGNIHELFSNLL